MVSMSAARPQSKRPLVITLRNDPNDPSVTPPPSPLLGQAPRLGPNQSPYWDTYDTVNQLYMEMSSKPEMRSHYRGHKMSLWLSLIPQLHRPGSDLSDPALRHHHFQDDNASYYEGAVRPQTLMKPHVPHVANAEGSGGRKEPARSTFSPHTAEPHPANLPPAPSTECQQNSSAATVSSDDALLRRLTSSNYQSYTTALTVTIAVGCFLFLLNVLIFAGIYHQKGSRSRSLKDNLAETGSYSSSDNYDGKLDYELRTFDDKGFSLECKLLHVSRGSGSKFDLRTLSDCSAPMFGEYSCYDEKNRAARSSLPDVSVGSAIDAGSFLCIDKQKPDIQNMDEGKQHSLRKTSTFEQRPMNCATQVKFEPGGANVTEASYKDESDSGILRVESSSPISTLPGIMKKKVQIQEISV